MINGKSKMEFAKIYTNITRVRKNNSRQIISKNALLQKKSNYIMYLLLNLLNFFFLTNRCRSCLLYEKLDGLIEISDQT